MGALNRWAAVYLSVKQSPYSVGNRSAQRELRGTLRPGLIEGREQVVSENVGVRPAPSPGVIGQRARGVLSLRNRSEEALIAHMDWLDPSQRDPLRRIARKLMQEASNWQIEQAQRRASERGRQWNL